ncbi:SDR family NAD(P)-dependent oxidoreductase [Cohnella nanjingensis]|uniref:SDR family oxidoreductase n=1 Tax=Cohnella nanjingensis TaxID=1387779 RepID=A0A7X0VGN7_9BACL|nr:SDR family NAD(P)-dependent oxidoreductase [Cohnella nanjingensis]MBB6673046.1 SDR family oxidoreductase [Cohnella nanjingensis]
MRLLHKTALITGAGSGIGRVTALRFASEGAQVIVNDLKAADGEETVRLIREQGGEATFLQADVTKASDVEQMVERALQTYGAIDILFNNAGISGIGAIHELSEELWDRVVNVNMKGVFLPCKYVVPHMIERGSGNIINMSSAIAEIGLMKRAVYAATKGAVLTLTKCMQVDYASHNIRVNALLPGTILTPFVEKYLKESYADAEEGLNTIRRRQLTGDLGRPEDVANAALFLASDESKFMMGSPLYIDGGCTFGKMA